MKADDRVLVYIARVRQLATDLKSLDVNDDGAKVALTVLSGLPKKFEKLIVAIDMTMEDNLSLDFVRSRLVQEKHRFSDCSHVKSDVDSALLGRRGNSSRYRTSRFSNYSKRPNHTEPFCLRMQRDQQVLYAKGLLSEGGNSSNGANPIDSDDVYCLFGHHAATDTCKSKQTDWIVDSGANTDMTFDRSLFQNFSDVKPFDVLTGNRTPLRVCGKGQVTLIVPRNNEPVRCILKDVMYVPTLSYHLHRSSSSLEQREGFLFE